MRSDRRGFQLALAASAGLHLVLAVVVVICAPSRQRVDPVARVSTRVEAPLRMEWREVDATVRTPDVPVVPSTPEPIVDPPATGSRPIATPVPATLPRSVIDLVRRHSSSSDAVLQPVAAAVPAAPRVLEGGDALHGSLAEGQTIVYLLDASGSMGQSGKLDRAKHALAATLREQPESVRFQVIVYAGFAKPLAPGGCQTATDENVERAIQDLAAIEPAGRSSHVEALRLAANLNPEQVLVLTDAEELPAAAIRDLLRRLARPPVVSLATVRGDGISVGQASRRP